MRDWIEIGIHSHAETGKLMLENNDDGPHILLAEASRRMWCYGFDKILKDILEETDWIDDIKPTDYGYTVLKITLGFEDDWYEENGGVPQLVSKGGFYVEDVKDISNDPVN